MTDPAGAALPATPTPTILVIEDDPAIAGMLELTFGLEGFDTETVSDGVAARTRLDGPPATVVVLDLMLPGVDGYTLLGILRERTAWSDTRVVVASALGEDEDVWRGWAAGADYYLVKPYDLEHLRDVVIRLAAGAEVPEQPADA